MSKIDMDAVRLAQRAYAKKWRAANPDKVREKNLRYWQRRAEREAAAATETGNEVNDGSHKN